MNNKLSRHEIAKGVHFSAISDPRFKLNRITVCFMSELSGSTAAKNALVPRILSKANAAYPTAALLNNRLSGMYAASLSDNVGKYGDTQYMGLSISVIDDAFALEGEKLSVDAAKILSECLFNPVLENGAFTEKTTALEKQSLIDEIEAELNDKRAYTRNRAIGVICKDEPAAVNPLGTVASAERITPADVYAAYLKLLETAPVEIICVGKNDFAETEKTLTEAFKKLKRGEIEKCESHYSAIKNSQITETEKLSVTQSKMVIGFKTTSKDIPALRIMSKVYGGTPASKLFLNVREKLSLCYYCWSRFAANKGILLIDCGVEAENIEKARKEILAQFDDMKKGNFTDEEIEFSKLSVQNDTKSVNDYPGGLSGWYLEEIYKGEILSPEESVERDLAVTRERIIAAANSMVLDTVYILTGND